jgi:hypothetical protein
MASPFLAGLVAGAFVYLTKPGTATLVIAISVATTGLVIGIIWANKILQKRGTMYFLSGIMATSELDGDDISKNNL